MQGAWIVAVAVAAGAYAGYALARRGGGQSQGGQGGQPSRSSPPSDRICPQVLVTCQDGSPAPTPCDCEGRGGVKRVGVMV
jgi:hypothetical protein